jgi:sugar lactone lactonase YvrE
MRSIRIIVVLLVLFTLVFCSKETEYPQQVEIVEGVKVITNPDYPRDGVFQLDLEEDLSIGVEEGDAKYMLNEPQDVQVTEDGTIYVVDWGDTCIKVYDTEGQYLRTIGREGVGPGEFSTPVYMDISADGKIFLMDGRNQRVVVLDTDGNYLGGIRVMGFHSKMRADELNRIYFQGQKYGEELKVLNSWQEIDIDTVVKRIEENGEGLFSFGPFRGEKRKRMKTKTGTMSLSSSYKVTWDVDREGYLYQGFNDEYAIHVFNPDGKKVLTFGREYTPVKNPRAKGLAGPQRYMPAYAPRWLLDEEGNLWIEIYTEEEEKEEDEDSSDKEPKPKPVAYDVFSPQGDYLRQVILPHRIYHFKNGKIYSIVATEEGFRVVKRLRIKDWESIKD